MLGQGSQRPSWWTRNEVSCVASQREFYFVEWELVEG